MGTTAEKGAYLNTTKSLLKDKINNLGGDITDETTFREYVEELQDIYDNLPKTEYQEGTDITIENGLKGKLDFDDGKVGFGQASQDSTQGYQLLNIPNIAETTKNGITYSCQNGILKLNGTATNGLDIWLWGTASSGQLNLESGAYTFAGQVISGSRVSGVCGKYVRNNAGASNIIDGNQIETYTQKSLTESYSNCSVYLYISNGTVLDNLVVGISLVKGLYTQSTMPPFEKYTGNSASPNPSYPQEIEVVRGRNLFNDELEVGGFDGEGLNSGGNVRLRSKGYTQIESNTNYTINAKNNTSKTLNVSISYYTANDFVTHRTGYLNFTTLPYTFSIPSGCKYIRVLFKYTDESSMNIENVSNVMLEKGSQATSYLPYNTLEVVERGKNLWYSSEYNNTYADLNIKFTNNKVILNGTNSRAVDLRVVDVSNNWNTNSQSILNYINNKNGNYCASNNSGFDTYFYMSSGSYSANTTQVTDSVKVNSIFIRIPINSTFTNKDIEFQLQEGSTATTYEPYQTPQTYQLSLGEYEFAKIGNYVDTIEYDVENDKVYKNEKVGKIVLDGSNDENWQMDYSTGFVSNRFTCDNLPSLDVTSQTNFNYGYCNIGKITSEANYSTYLNVVKLRYINNQNRVDCMFDIESLNAFKTLLNQIPMEIYYQRLDRAKLTEITTTLKDQVKALYNSHSFNGTTIITSNGDLPMIIKVRGLKGE